MEGNGGFNTPEGIELIKEADIIVTNPPFSLFREFVATLEEYGKKYLILGNMNAITYKEIFPLIKENKTWLGFNASGHNLTFITDKNEQKDVTSVWFTNLDHNKRHEPLDLYKHYTPEEYPKYDNYDAINVNKVCDIPMDYDGVIGVPITFLEKYCPEQFEIIGCHEPCINLELYKTIAYFNNIPSRQINYNGKICQKTYHRLFIKTRL